MEPVPKVLTDDQKAQYVAMQGELSKCFEKETMFLDRMITGDEKWPYKYNRKENVNVSSYTPTSLQSRKRLS